MTIADRVHIHADATFLLTLHVSLFITLLNFSFHNAMCGLGNLAPQSPCPRVFFNYGLNKWFVIVMLPLYLHFTQRTLPKFTYTRTLYIFYDNVHLWRLFELWDSSCLIALSCDLVKPVAHYIKRLDLGTVLAFHG